MRHAGQVYSSQTVCAPVALSTQTTIPYVPNFAISRGVEHAGHGRVLALSIFLFNRVNNRAKHSLLVTGKSIGCLYRISSRNPQLHLAKKTLMPSPCAARLGLVPKVAILDFRLAVRSGLNGDEEVIRSFAAQTAAQERNANRVKLSGFPALKQILGESVLRRDDLPHGRQMGNLRQGQKLAPQAGRQVRSENG